MMDQSSDLAHTHPLPPVRLDRRFWYEPRPERAIVLLLRCSLRGWRAKAKRVLRAVFTALAFLSPLVFWGLILYGLYQLGACGVRLIS